MKENMKQTSFFFKRFFNKKFIKTRPIVIKEAACFTGYSIIFPVGSITQAKTMK
jgi:hypothetical protein